MSGTNDNSPHNTWWIVLILAVIGAATTLAVELIRRGDANDAEPLNFVAHHDDPPLAPPAAPMLRITNLSSGSQVVHAPIVEGVASGAIEQVWLLVQTRETPPKCWLQGPAGLGENRTWRIPAEFGRSPSLDSGSRFSVSAIAGPPRESRQGSVSCALSAAVRSSSVEVTRQ